uniref:Acidic leucine-rich nuclear phosphoprotein 32-related protein n=2 Tax=Anthurium amnicola TaxID=1678845 RepID=A0A1D1Z027_9ARAE
MIGSTLIFALNLKELRLADNEITSLPTELARNTMLQNLDLGKNLLMRLSDLKVLSELHNLKNLNLQGNPVAENPKLIKKIRKLVPNLQIFNAKPIERWNESKKIPEKDVSAPVEGVRYREDAIGLESKLKKKKSKADDTLSGKKRSDSNVVASTDPVDVEPKIETKIKKPKVAENPVGKVVSMINEDKRSPFSANEAKVKAKEKKLAKANHNTEFDDKETSFMDFILSEEAHERPVGKPSSSQAAWGKKLLGGVVVDHTKSKKAKNSRRGLPALQFSQIPDFGIGGPSTWDD